MERNKPLRNRGEYYFQQDDCSLAEIYHLNTNLLRSSRSRHLSEEQLVGGAWGKHIKRYESAAQIRLPQQVSEPTLSLAQALRSRCSARAWQEKMLSLDQLSIILRLGAGIVRVDELAGKTAYYRSAPSGGARYPIEVYPVVMNVEGVSPGVYHYNILDHTLDTLCETDTIEEYLLHATVYPEFVQNASVAFFLTAVGERTMGKYADRGYRYILLEAGHIAQNICLLTTSLELGSLCIAGFYEQDIESLLWIDGSSEFLVYTVMAGLPVEF